MKKISFLLIFPVLLFLCLPNAAFFASDNDNQENLSSRSQNEMTFEEGEVLVQLKPDSSVNDLVQEERVTATPVTTDQENDGIVLVKSTEEKTTESIIGDLEKNPDVEIAQPNFKYKPLGRYPTNDKYYSRQWWLFNTAVSPGGLSAPSAWVMESKKQEKVVIAVIDSGANLKHKDLKKNFTKGSAKGVNFEIPGKKPTDDDGHGTLVSGAIAAISKNKRGLAGPSLKNNLRIMPLRFDYTTSQAITAIDYAKSKKVPVINASWGGYGTDGFDLLLKNAIARYPGIFVTASGNYGLNHDGMNPNEKMYPCDFDLANIICVGASDRSGNLTSYSDYGNVSVDVVAPGGTDGSPIMSLSRSSSNYTEGEGSSLSAAFVSAEAGLLKSKYPRFSSSRIISIIKNSVDTRSGLAGKVLTGGKVNFKKALDRAATY